MIRRQSTDPGLRAFGLWRISWGGLCDGKFIPKTSLQTDFRSKRRTKRMRLWLAVSLARWRSVSTKSLNRTQIADAVASPRSADTKSRFSALRGRRSPSWNAVRRHFMREAVSSSRVPRHECAESRALRLAIHHSEPVDPSRGRERKPRPESDWTPKRCHAFAG